MNDSISLDGLKKQEDIAYRDLYAVYSHDLVRFADTYLYDKELAKDIVQEVFVHIWENAGDISISTSLKGYLYATVKNRCLNELKRIKVFDSSGLLEFMAKVDSDFYEDIEEDSFKSYVIKSVVDQLPKKMRQIVRMKYFKEYSYQEIAEELNVSLNTVKTQLKRAKLKISKKLVSDTGMRIVGFLALVTSTTNYFYVFLSPLI